MIIPSIVDLQPGQIHISESCQDGLKGTDFITVFRGTMDIKVGYVDNNIQYIKYTLVWKYNVTV